MSAIFISDVHLRDSTSVKSKLVMRFFQEVASKHSQIFILGDLFDVWPGTSAYLIENFKPITDVLRRLSLEGHEINYIEGNHDFRLGRYFTDELGINVFPDEYITEWSGKRIYMAHGDLGNPKDKGYKVLRSLLRQDLLHWAIRPIPDKWIFDLGAKSSGLSRKYQQQRFSPTLETKIRQTYRHTAHKIFQKGYDVVIMGHTHLPDELTTYTQGRPCRYFNTGDWVRHFTYLEFDGGQFYTKVHPVKDL